MHRKTRCAVYRLCKSARASDHKRIPFCRSTFSPFCATANIAAQRAEGAVSLRRSQREGEPLPRIAQGVDLQQALEYATTNAALTGTQGTCTACVVRQSMCSPTAVARRYLRTVCRRQTGSVVNEWIPFAFVRAYHPKNAMVHENSRVLTWYMRQMTFDPVYGMLNGLNVGDSGALLVRRCDLSPVSPPVFLLNTPNLSTLLSTRVQIREVLLRYCRPSTLLSRTLG